MERRVTAWAPLVAAACCLAFAGCDQFARVGVVEPEVENAGAGAASLPEGEAGAAAVHDAAVADAAGGTRDGGSTSDAGTTCAPVEIAVCNPVTNQGCSAALGMQCAVDFTVPLGGYCIFYSGPPPALGGACLNTGVTESCAPTSACVGDRCRQLCLCDADCDEGQCCSDPLQGTGFKVCGEC